jgi:hypothetical protein
MIEGVFSEEVVPKNEHWSSTIAVEVVVPFFKKSNQLITFLSDAFFREE